MILPDNETRVDLLNNEAIAATIIALLRARNAGTPSRSVFMATGARESLASSK